MKMILNNRYFGKSLLLVSACSLWMLGACTGDFMETNTDPNAVTEEELGYDNLGTGSMITQMQYQMYPCITKDQNIDVNNYQKMFSLAGDIFSGHQGASNMFDSNGRNNTTYDSLHQEKYQSFHICGGTDSESIRYAPYHGYVWSGPL